MNTKYFSIVLRFLFFFFFLFFFGKIARSMNSIIDDVELDHFVCISSLPGAPESHFHRDAAPIFNMHGKSNNVPRYPLPPYAYIGILPLVDMTDQIGPTEFLLRSHVPCRASDMVKPNPDWSKDDDYQAKTHFECNFATQVLRAGLCSTAIAAQIPF